MRSKIKICCKEFAKQMLDKPSLAGGISLYPRDFQPNSQGEYDEEEKNWNVNGCCGGGCYVLTDLRYCPWCGKDLSPTPKEK